MNYCSSPTGGNIQLANDDEFNILFQKGMLIL